MSFYHGRKFLPQRFRLVLSSVLQTGGLPFSDVFPQFAERLLRQVRLYTTLRGPDASPELKKSAANDETPRRGKAPGQTGSQRRSGE